MRLGWKVGIMDKSLIIGAAAFIGLAKLMQQNELLPNLEDKKLQELLEKFENCTLPSL